MLRFVFFVLATLFLARVLGHLPFVGGLFARTGFLGLLITALLLSWFLSRWGEYAVRVQRQRAELRALEAVPSPRNRGKMGTLYLNRGSVAKAAELFEEARAGEPEIAEWHYRKGQAELARGRPEDALQPLGRAVEIDEEHAYGAAMLRLAEARERTGDDEAALGALERFERNHGPSPESAYRRGKLLASLGRKDEARAAHAEIDALVRHAPRYQKAQAQKWQWKARLFRVG